MSARMIDEEDEGDDEVVVSVDSVVDGDSTVAGEEDDPMISGEGMRKSGEEGS